MRQWSFVTDMNYDQAVTISDVWLWLKWIYFYPGDALILLLLNGFPAVGRFFEMDSSSYGNWFSGIISIPLWILIFYMFLSKQMWVSEKYDETKPFWKRTYGFWPTMLIYFALMGGIFFVVSKI